MNSPTTYAEWATLIDSFAEGDDSALAVMQTGSFTVDAGTGIRFYTRIEEAYKMRKKRWLEKFQKSFETSNIRRIEEFEIALRNGRQNLKSLSTFVSMPGFPEDIRKTLSKDLLDFVGEIKNSLKTSFSKLDKDRDRMILMLSSFDLPASEETIPKNTLNENKNNIPDTGSGRKIIF